MRLLVSVRDIAEARIAAREAGFIDLKEPSEGALGGLPPASVRAIVSALRRDGVTLPISATIGDHATADGDAIVAAIDAIGACGVDYVKVGIDGASPRARGLLQSLAGSAWAVVPVFLADHGVDLELVGFAATLGFPALMVDTADKASGSLFDVMTEPAIAAFIRVARAHGVLAGVAGALRLEHAARLASLAPDFAGFRTAVCAGDRTGALDPERLAELAHRMSQSTLTEIA